jgi:hypothetical protein
MGRTHHLYTGAKPLGEIVPAHSSKKTRIFRDARFFEDPDLADLYKDFDPKHPKGLAQYEGTDKDAGWEYRRERDRRDSRAIADLVVNPGYDLNELRRRQDAGEDMTKEWEKATRTSFQGATLERFTVRQFGPYFVLPADYTMGDFYRDDKVKDAKKLHPDAGKIPPVSPEWLERTPEWLLDAVEEDMKRVHGGRTAEAAGTF